MPKLTEATSSESISSEDLGIVEEFDEDGVTEEGDDDGFAPGDDDVVEEFDEDGVIEEGDGDGPPATCDAGNDEEGDGDELGASSGSMSHVIFADLPHRSTALADTSLFPRHIHRRITTVPIWVYYHTSILNQ